MTCHLATRRDILCHTLARWPAKSGDLRDVTCTRCLNRFDIEVVEGAEAYCERRRAAQVADAAEYLGAGFLWSLVADVANPSDRVVRDVLGAVLICVAEMHCVERAA